MFGHDWSIGHKPSNDTLNQSCAHQNSHLFQAESVLSLLFYTRQSRFPAASVRDPQGASYLGLEGSSRPLLTASGLVSSGSARAGTISWFPLGGNALCSHKSRVSFWDTQPSCDRIQAHASVSCLQQLGAGTTLGLCHSVLVRSLFCGTQMEGVKEKSCSLDCKEQHLG